MQVTKECAEEVTKDAQRVVEVQEGSGYRKFNLSAQDFPVAKGHVGVAFHHSALYVGGSEVGGSMCIGRIGNSEGGDARGEIVGMVATKGEVGDISVEGSGDNRDLETKSGGALTIGKELSPQDGHPLLFGGTGDDMPEGW